MSQQLQDLTEVIGSMVGAENKMSGYVVVNEMLCQTLGAISALIYSKLVLIHTYKENADKLTEDGYFPCSYSLLQDNLGISRRAQDTAIKTLCDAGLIRCENKLYNNNLIRHVAVVADITLVDRLIVDAYNKKYNTNIPYRCSKEE